MTAAISYQRALNEVRFVFAEVACSGNAADVNSLTMISAEQLPATITCLNPALRESLGVPDSTISLNGQTGNPMTVGQLAEKVLTAVNQLSSG